MTLCVNNREDLNNLIFKNIKVSLGIDFEYYFKCSNDKYIRILYSKNMFVMEYNPKVINIDIENFSYKHLVFSDQVFVNSYSPIVYPLVEVTKGSIFNKI